VVAISNNGVQKTTDAKTPCSCGSRRRNKVNLSPSLQTGPPGAYVKVVLRCELVPVRCAPCVEPFGRCDQPHCAATAGIGINVNQAPRHAQRDAAGPEQRLRADERTCKKEQTDLGLETVARNDRRTK